MIDYNILILCIGGSIISLRLEQELITLWFVLFTVLSSLLIALSIVPAACDYVASSHNFCNTISFVLGIGTRYIVHAIGKVFDFIKQNPIELLKKFINK